MAIDPLSPVAPARIRALLLPVGRIKRSRFLAFVDLLQPQCLVRLGDVSPDPRPDRNMFSPLAFPSGILLYDFSTSLPFVSRLSLSPFEQFREPLLIIGIGDATEYPWLDRSRDDDATTEIPESEEEHAQEISSAVEHLREQFPKAYLHSFMLFDSVSQTRHPRLPQETLLVPPVANFKRTTMKTFMCDLTSTLLAEMTTLAKSIQALPTVPSPSSQNGTSENTQSWASAESAGSQSSRRNSQVPAGSRPGSPVSTAQKDNHRMSMPVLPSASGSPLATEDPRSSSPTTQGARTPPTTFDEISGVNAANALHRTNSSSSKSNAAKRDSSADRLSMHGFGSGGIGERARNKGRGRISIVVGTLYLTAGQWQDAMRELVDGATRARSLSDHLWHAKALENIMVCLLLFAWSGLDFQIPPICFPLADKTSASKSPQHTPSNSVADITSTANSKSTNHEASLESLNSLLPDLVNMIINIYTRASNFAGESLPPLAFSECIIRFSKLLAAMNLSAGSLDEDALQHLVQNTPYRQKPRLSIPRLSVHPTRNDIATMLFRALPGSTEFSGINPTDRVVVLAGIASVLSSLGLQRKKAIVMKEFITSLIPGLVQARKAGAAEMGVHPAAGLAALNMVSGGSSGAGSLNLGEGEMENGISEFLGLLGSIYGIPDEKSTLRGPNTSTSKRNDASAQQEVKNSHAEVEKILSISSLRAFGSLNLKLDILRMCINFCEALPDFNGVLHFTALLLRMAGPGTAPKTNSTDVFVSLPREEQVRLFSHISRTVAAAKKLGIEDIETDYWDDFLVRGLFIVEESFPLRLTQHRPAELRNTASAKKEPFIHNPWIKKPQAAAAEPILVANEQYHFVIALQNPYDFELDVDSLTIAAEGVDFRAHEKNFILGPYRTQKFPITGIATSSGTLNIIGCLIKVTGCRERLFPIFPDPWKPEKESKMKKIGLTACVGAPTSRPSSSLEVPSGVKKTNAPKPDSLTFHVIPDQPLLVISDVSLPQGALMILEGEKKRFIITVKNTSQTTRVDFVHISFQDSATAAIQAATSNRDLPPAELHELEFQLAHYPSLRWCKDENEETITIRPGGEAKFEVEVVGRTRLTDAVIQIDYANLGKRRSEVQDRFFTRQVSVPISITVNASVQLQRPDVVPLSRDFAWSHQRNQAGDASDKKSIQYPAFLRNPGNQDANGEYCMMLLDLRNSWPNPLTITLQVRDLPSSDNDTSSSSSWQNVHTSSEVIQPGHVNRVVVVLPKVYLPDPHAPIPSLNPANQRQFVVSASKISPEAERANREAFWYRQEALKLIRGTWTEDAHHNSDGSNGERHGELELRGIRFSPRMVEAIKLDDLSIDLAIVPDSPPDAPTSSSPPLPNSRNSNSNSSNLIQTNTFYILLTTLHNRSPSPIAPLLRLQPHLPSSLPHNIALDLDKRFSWNGVLQKRLPVIKPGRSVTSELGVVALASGVFEIGACVDEAVRLPQRRSSEAGPPKEEDELELLGDVLKGQEGGGGEMPLRTWFLSENFVLVARRGVDDGDGDGGV